MKTYSQKASEVTHTWVEIDASSAPLGRVATVIATRLTGKYKPTYTPSMDSGDYVVVTNAEKLVVTGNKEVAKTYYRHTEYPGGIKSRTLAESRVKDPTKVIMAAVKGMLPRNKLAAERLKRLRVFVGEDHTHAPQKPVKIEVK
ncbi:50S ribosomal protein L13 [Pedobacter sp.]|nr:50S ribosomal protein L13 [Candidatus Saccharibacteria bacterium]